ncbi:tail fiber protein [Pedobacter sp.]|uniref:phage tail protein n=1 Tax=Pedobacter sp. TaxID=1411316 RepID=UPI0031D7D42F
MDEYLAIIKMFAATFAPRGWAFCSGQLIAVNTNSALYALLGTNFGGNGQTTFGLPDLRGRVPVGSNGGIAGPGLGAYVLGQVGGTENTVLTLNNLPGHTHTATGAAVKGSSAIGNTDTPINNYLALSPKIGSGPNAATLKTYVTPAAAGTTGDIAGVSQPTNAPSGSNSPFSNMQPYLGMNYIICMEGIFPSRN